MKPKQMNWNNGRDENKNKQQQQPKKNACWWRVTIFSKTQLQNK